MTLRKSFKKLVRERMAETGESYTQARMHIMAQQDAERVFASIRRNAAPVKDWPEWKRKGTGLL